MTVTAKHVVSFEKLKSLIDEIANEHQLTDLEQLAVAANMVGKMLSICQHRVLMAQALEVIRLNTKLGFSQGDAGV